jgi:hypothetical protein
MNAPASNPAQPPRALSFAPRRLLAVLMLVFAGGFLAGYWFHQPITPIRDAEIVASIQQASRETDRVLAEQRRLLDCAAAKAVPGFEPATPPTPTAPYRARRLEAAPTPPSPRKETP